MNLNKNSRLIYYFFSTIIVSLLLNFSINSINIFNLNKKKYEVSLKFFETSHELNNSSILSYILDDIATQNNLKVSSEGSYVEIKSSLKTTGDYNKDLDNLKSLINKLETLQNEINKNYYEKLKKYYENLIKILLDGVYKNKIDFQNIYSELDCELYLDFKKMKIPFFLMGSIEDFLMGSIEDNQVKNIIKKYEAIQKNLNSNNNRLDAKVLEVCEISRNLKSLDSLYKKNLIDTVLYNSLIFNNFDLKNHNIEKNLLFPNVLFKFTIIILISLIISHIILIFVLELKNNFLKLK